MSLLNLKGTLHARAPEICVGLARTVYIRCIHGIFRREIAKYTVIYGVCIRIWPSLDMCDGERDTSSTKHCIATARCNVKHTVMSSTL